MKHIHKNRPKFQFNVDAAESLPVNAMFDEEDDESSQGFAFGSEQRRKESGKKKSERSEKRKLINTGEMKQNKRYKNSASDKNSEADSAHFRMNKGGAGTGS